MADYFDAPSAYNPDTEQLVPNAEFQVFALGDVGYATPLAVFEEPSGVVLSPLRSNSIGMLPQFRVAGEPQEVILRSGSFTTRLTSKFGSKGEPGAPGSPGAPGTSAYQAAQSAGYTGSEVALSQAFAQVPDVVDHAVTSSDTAGPVVFHGVFAEGAEPTPDDDGATHIGWRIPAP